MQRQSRPGTARGFTLIELMIVVAIIGLLSSVALPSFRTMQLRARRIERDLMMAEIERSMKDYLNERGRSAVPHVAEWNPALPPGATQRPFDRNIKGWSALTFKPDGPLRYSYYVLENPGVTPSFTVLAQGDLDGDGKFNWTWHTWGLSNDFWGNFDQHSDDKNDIW